MSTNAMHMYFAPGRVNLIGEHLDYNGGLVMPVAINLGITATVIERSDDKVSLESTNHPGKREFYLSDDFQFSGEQGWTNYPLGVIQQLKKEGYECRGLDILFDSNLPEGSGLSSSAALEVLTAYIFLHQSNAHFDLVWLANFCKQVENDFIGVQCGIMDQYAVALGKADNALLLDCNLLHHEYVPFELSDYTLLIMDTRKPRSLIHSKYNERKVECEEALRIINVTQSDIQHLCEAHPHQLALLHDDVLYRRAKHVITENLRVREGAKVLEVNDLSTFGRLMNASHQSLRDDYEVSGLELDSLVAAAQQEKGCLGARMTGAGFGGCAIAIVNHKFMNNFIENVGERYFADTNLNAAFYNATIVDGVKLIS